MLFSKFVDKLCSGMCVADAAADVEVVVVAVDGPLGGLKRCCCWECCCCWLGETPPPRNDDEEGVALRDLWQRKKCQKIRISYVNDNI